MFLLPYLAVIGGQMAASIAKQRLDHAMAQDVDACAAGGDVIDVTARFIDDALALPAPTARVQA